MNGIPTEGKPDLQRSDLFLIATGSLLVGVGLLIPVAVGWMLVELSSLPDVFRAGPPVTILALGFGGAILCIASARIRARYGKDHEAEAVASPGTAWQCGCGVTNTGSRTKCRACGTPIGGVWTPESAKGPLGTVERIRSCGVIALGLCAILAALWATSWSLGREQWGPFRGQIVDVETGQPIEGAAVVIVWWVTIPTPVHGVRSFYDAREAVTDAEGRFKAPGRWPAIFWLMVHRPHVIFFCPGLLAVSSGGDPTRWPALCRPDHRADAPRQDARRNVEEPLKSVYPLGKGGRNQEGGQRKEKKARTRSSLARVEAY